MEVPQLCNTIHKLSKAQFTSLLLQCAVLVTASRAESDSSKYDHIIYCPIYCLLCKMQCYEPTVTVHGTVMELLCPYLLSGGSVLLHCSLSVLVDHAAENDDTEL